ncbi:MAG: monovalent cation:proton antiporter-2 (CPA2) family protein [Gammaproteobacteria bacterium]
MSQYSIQLILVYLSAALIAVPLAKRLGLGSVLGYLIAGIIIGPYCLDFAGEAHSILHAAEFGVVMMLFMIGIELEPHMLWSMRASILGLGGIQVIGSALAIGLLAFLFFALSWQQAIVIGLMLSLSSTAIILQSLRENGLTRTPIGYNAFSVLLFQDIAVIPMLAFFPLLVAQQKSGEVENITSSALAIVAIILSIILSGMYLVKPFFRWLAHTRLRELFTTASLVLVVGVSYLMDLVGISPALGAFLAGVLFAESEFRHEIETAIEPFKSLIMGVFFVAVGAAMQFSVVLENPFWVISSVLILVLVKAGVLGLIASLFKFPLPLSWSFMLTLPQGGEFAFVLATYALSLGLLTQVNFELINIIVALSMLITPLLLTLDVRIIQPHFRERVETEKKDAPSDAPLQESPSNPVIIAGFGRFGQVVGRFLKYNGIDLTLLDLDPNLIQVSEKAGFKVYYGDATRRDLLHAAGADAASVLKHFPHLHIIVRAVDRLHAYELSNREVAYFSIETFGSALDLGAEVMVNLGYHRYHATKNAQLFEHHDKKHLKEMAKLWHDEKAYFMLHREKSR